MMRAVWLKEFGPPEVLQLGDAPEPIAGDGQVVVAVEFVNITFVETQFRSGMPGPFSGTALPVIPGNGVGGRVRAVGPDVSPRSSASRVVTATGGAGGYAERVAVPAAGLIPVPDEVAMDDAVALLADGRTAMLLVRNAELRAGERVLVEAAAGGLGSLLVQLAHNAGHNGGRGRGRETQARGRPRARRRLRGRLQRARTGPNRSAPRSARSTSCSTASAARSARRRSTWSPAAAACPVTAWPAGRSRASPTTRQPHAASRILPRRTDHTRALARADAGRARGSGRRTAAPGHRPTLPTRGRGRGACARSRRARLPGRPCSCRNRAAALPVRLRAVLNSDASSC